MLHKLMIQLAEAGGEIVLGLLLLVSIVSVAIISNRIWFFARHRMDGERLAGQLLQTLCIGDLTKAWGAAHRSKTSLGLVIAAGLTQIERGRHAARAAICSARLRERTRLEGELGVLRVLGESALLLGLLGTLLDWMRLKQPGSASATLEVLAPLAAGLFVAIPAIVAARVLDHYVRMTLRRIDSLAHLLLLQLDDRPQNRAAAERSGQQRAA